MIATGRQIAAARALLGWSQQQLAKAAGLHVNAVGYWEARTEIPCGSLKAPIACRRIETALLDAGVLTLVKPTIGVRVVANSQIRCTKRGRARVMGS
jgi:transcriptional regulator with XRE-family HTH domain